MFEANDRALLTTRKIIIAFLIIFALGSLAAGIALAVVMEQSVYLLVALPGWFACWLTWVFARLYMSYLCDVKLIRNKLYGASNDNLSPFLTGVKELEKEEKKEDLEEAKLALEDLRASGSISEEEYIKQKEELLEAEKQLDETDKKE